MHRKGQEDSAPTHLRLAPRSSPDVPKMQQGPFPAKSGTKKTKNTGLGAGSASDQRLNEEAR
jgi:hypothetical protein